jgi:hypothetical protein
VKVVVCVQKKTARRLLAVMEAKVAGAVLVSLTQQLLSDARCPHRHRVLLPCRLRKRGYEQAVHRWLVVEGATPPVHSQHTFLLK